MTSVTPLEPAVQEEARPDQRPRGMQRTLRLSFWSRVEIAAASQAAPHHRVNEDAHSVLAEVSRLMVLADGVGGGAMASQVSRQLVAALHARLDQGGIDAARIDQAVLEADRELRETLARQTAEPGAATLALCAPAGGDAAEWWIAWVGDCRVYAVGTGREEPARLLTRDDSYRHLGETPPRGGAPDDPARMVGNGAVERANLQRVRLRRGERLLLCSDGVHKHLTAYQMGELLRAHKPLDQRCGDLVTHARRAGSTDDATVLVLERRRFVWVLAGAALLALLVALLFGGIALWNAYGLGGRAVPAVFEAGGHEKADEDAAVLPPVTEPASAAPLPGRVPP